MSNECVIWQGSKDTGGYGLKRYKGKLYKAHRYMWMITNGDIPEGLFVCHACDTRACINVDHLFLGTNSDNMLDMYNKGRGNNFFKEHNPNRKLSSDDVATIRHLRAEGATQQSVADTFGIDRSLVSQIDRRMIWN